MSSARGACREDHMQVVSIQATFEGSDIKSDKRQCRKQLGLKESMISYVKGTRTRSTTKLRLNRRVIRHMVSGIE